MIHHRERSPSRPAVPLKAIGWALGVCILCACAAASVYGLVPALGASAGVLAVGGIWWSTGRQRIIRRDAGDRSESLFDALTDTVLLVDAEGTFVDYHARTKTAGRSGTRAVGRRLPDALPPGIADTILRTVRQVLETGETRSAECSAGVEGPFFEARAVPCWDDRAVVVVRRLTERDRADRTAREAESKFQILVEQSLAGIFIVQGGRLVYVNPRFAEILGYTPEELTAFDGLSELVVPEDRLTMWEKLGGDSLEKSQYVLRWIRKDREVVFGEVYSTVTDYQDAPAVIGTMLDVTNQHEAQEKLRVLGMAVEQSAEGVLVIDTNGMVRFANPAWARMHGWDVQEVTGQHFRIFHTEEQMRREVFPVINRFESTRVYRAEMGHKRRDGSTFPSLTAFASLRDDGGQVLGAVGICRDITEQKQYESEILTAKERAEDMSRLKSVFLTNMSHEIRTPLAGIIGCATVLEEEVSEDQGEFAALIRTSGERLLDTLNAVLDLARLEAGEMLLVPEPVDLREEVEDAVGMFRVMAQEKGLDFRVSFSEAQLPACVDPHGLGMVLNNLVGNAVKFTEEGEVVVTVAADDEQVRLSVTDTGIGIDRAFMPFLFDEFKQESDGLTRTHEGSGLGLSITRRLVHLMDGEIEVESTRGAGSTFRVVFPRYRTARALSSVA